MVLVSVLVSTGSKQSKGIAIIVTSRLEQEYRLKKKYVEW